MLEGLTVENWVGTHPLGVSASLVSKAKAVIGVDTGLTHMGIAAGAYGSSIWLYLPLH